MVAATKMRKSQEIPLASRPYAFAALDFLATVSNLDSAKLPELFHDRTKNPSTSSGPRVLFVLVSSDKGLAGAFNSSVFRKFAAHFEKWASLAPKGREEQLFVAIGEKANQYLSKKGYNVVKKFTAVGDHTTVEQVKPIADFIVEGFLAESWDRVVVVSTHFRSALKQEPHVRTILPIDFDHIAETIKEIIPERGKFADLIKEQNISFIPSKTDSRDYLIEPSAEEVLNNLAKHLFFMQMYHIILEANASEHSARRMAMKTASDNAKDLGDRLNLQYNKSRQSRITTEISEISAGAEALS